MINFLLPFECFSLCFAVVGGVVFALAYLLDWLCGLLDMCFQNQKKKDR